MVVLYDFSTEEISRDVRKNKKKKYLLKTFIVAFIKILLYVKLYLASYVYICPYEIDQVSSKNIRLRFVICGDIYTYIYIYIYIL